MNYNRVYNELIENAKHRGWTKKTAPTYVECHHIIPRSLGGSNSKDNLVFLEFNANGQWVFLDYTGEIGLVKTVANYLLPTL